MKFPFLLDANIFIQASRSYYAFDLCPGFWAALARHELGSIDKIREELLSGDDELKDWVETTLPRSCFADSDGSEVQMRYRQIIAWVQTHPRYLDFAKAEFAMVADGWLVAYAKAHCRTIVTHEKPEPGGKKRVKIPDVCLEFGVSFVDTFSMLRTVGASFTLDDG